MLSVKLNLTNGQKEYLKEFAKNNGTSITDILTNFCYDLIGCNVSDCFDCSNGHDERMFAEQWFYRCLINFRRLE